MAGPVIEALDPPVQAKSPRPQRRRFLVVYALLGLALAGAVAGLVLLLAKPGDSTGDSWSAWRPEGDGSQRTEEIAAHVAPAYHLSTGQQIVGVQSAPLQVQDSPIGSIVVRHAPAAGTTQGDVVQFDPATSVIYVMCGFGENCAITAGTPSEERMRLLRREALELALYTFRYVDGKDTVVAFLPPRPGDEPSLALFFQRGDYASQLDSPLRATLPGAVPPVPEEIPASEVTTIDRLTSATMYRYEFRLAQNGMAILVLDDPALPQDPEPQQPAQEQPVTQ